MDALLERNVVTPEIYKRHDAATTDTCRNRLVLDFLMKGSQENLDEFIKILEEQGQSHIVPLFLVQGNAKNYILRIITVQQIMLIVSLLTLNGSNCT